MLEQVQKDEQLGKELLRMKAQGMSDEDIANEKGFSRRTVVDWISSLGMKKLLGEINSIRQFYFDLKKEDPEKFNRECTKLHNSIEQGKKNSLIFLVSILSVEKGMSAETYLRKVLGFSNHTALHMYYGASELQVNNEFMMAPNQAGGK